MDTLNQAKNLIAKSHNILISPSQELQGDNLSSVLALFLTLKKLGKDANVLIEKIPEKFQFLTNQSDLSPLFQDTSDKNGNFVISIATSEKEISEIRYEKNRDDTKIHIAVNRGKIEEKDISLCSAENFNSQNPDLLITLGAGSLEGLGKPFDENPRLFYETPILNIDNQSLNESFGQVNLVETTSSSLAEIVTTLIRSMDSEIDESVATCLLTGVICASQNFRNSKTKPKTFETASLLIEKGANHQKIIQHLYKQKGVSQLKLLGRILEKLNFDEKKELYSVFLTEKDFQDCRSVSKDLGFVIEELKFNFRHLSTLLILWESHASPVLIKGIFYSQKLNLVEKILENFEGTSKGEGALFLIRDTDLNSAKEKVLKIL